MFERLETCPLCDSGHFTNYLICKDHSVSQEQFAIVQCTNCSFLFTNPRPASDQLSQYYDSKEYISHQDKGNTPINFIYRLTRKFTLKRKVKLIGNVSKKKNLLDIGCGTGHFLDAAKSANWQVTGIEPNDTARKQAIQKGIPVFDQLESLKKDNKYHCITLWHVLEHIPDINKSLQLISKHMPPSGTLIVAVPNADSYDAGHYKDKWAAYDVPRHLYHFTPATMKALMKKHGLKVKAIKPMKLDAYYVSLLSEKYLKPGIFNYLKAIVTGWKSNKYANKNNNNYSSLIFIIKK
ncbi:MAG: class I SAM-dependent methyltransferase [Fulvivirga sp.]|nr:class I SAM-dependent methyltransferase [Fulvivirga sp.]